MRRVFALVLALLCCAAAHAGPSSPARADTHQLLVMLRAPAVHDRPDAGYVSDYGPAPGHAARARTARKLAAANGLHVRGDWPMPALGVDCYVLEAPSAEALASAAQVLAHDPRVESVQAVQDFRTLSGDTGGDPLYPAQPAGVAWKLRELHESTTGRGVTVAVIDSGIAPWPKAMAPKSRA